MLRRYPVISVIFVYLIALLTVDALAAEAPIPPTPAALHADRTSDWNLNLSTLFLPSADVHGVPASIGTEDYRIKLTRTLKFDDKLAFTAGVEYGNKHIDTTPATALPSDLHSLALELGARYRLNSASFINITVKPGFYSDFKEIGDDDLRLPVIALGGYRFDNGITAVGGFIYRFGYHSIPFIPALGFSFQPNEFWKIDVVAPRPSVTYNASRQIQFFVTGDMSGDEYELKDSSSGAKVLSYNDFKVSAGLTYLPIPVIRLTSDVGYSFDRRFKFYEGNRSDMRMDNVPFFRISAGFNW